MRLPRREGGPAGQRALRDWRSMRREPDAGDQSLKRVPLSAARLHWLAPFSSRLVVARHRLEQETPRRETRRRGPNRGKPTDTVAKTREPSICRRDRERASNFLRSTSSAGAAPRRGLRSTISLLPLE